MSFQIKKVTGDIEDFDKEKLRRSLMRPGASPEIADKIVNQIERNKEHFKTTDDVYSYALTQLKETNPHIAARYNLKKALLEFGPTGFPFEKFVDQIFKAQGYETKIDQIVSGWCVDHEIDLIVKKGNDNFMIECKFHNEQWYKTDVQVTLYTNARFLDIAKTWSPDKKMEKLTKSWVVTNTKFTDEAIKYGNCIGMGLMGWDYPKESSLPDLVDSFGLYPVTALTSLSNEQKKFFVDNGFVLCGQVHKYTGLLEQSGLKGPQLNQFVRECELTSKVK